MARKTRILRRVPWVGSTEGHGAERAPDNHCSWRVGDIEPNGIRRGTEYLAGCSGGRKPDV